MSENEKRVDKTYLEDFDFLQRTGAFENLEKLRRENRLLDSLLNDTAIMYTLPTIEEILTFASERALQQFIPSFLLILMDPPRTGDLRQYCYANLKPSDKRLSVSSFKPLEAWAQASPYVASFESIQLDDAARRELERFNADILIPMRGIEGVYGVIVLGRKVLGQPYTDSERTYLDKLSRLLSIAIQNNLHHESAITDVKTGLYNHSYFLRRLTQEIAHVSRHKTKAGLIMIDIDHFKRFNDTWGHLAGDEVLNALAIALRGAVRSEDVVSRFGGEEFCVLSIECDAPGLWDMAERIRDSIAGLAVPYKGKVLSVTGSLGCCMLEPGLISGATEYIEMADKALYQSKEKGRNRTTIYRPGLYGRSLAVLGSPRASPKTP